MAHITYTFEELEVFAGVYLLASGSAEIIYTMEPADPDVGYRGGADYQVEEVYLASIDPTKEDMKVEPDTDLYKQIVKQLYSDKHASWINDECEENEESRGYDDY